MVYFSAAWKRNSRPFVVFKIIPSVSSRVNTTEITIQGVNFMYVFFNKMWG